MAHALEWTAGVGRAIPRLRAALAYVSRRPKILTFEHGLSLRCVDVALSKRRAFSFRLCLGRHRRACQAL